MQKCTLLWSAFFTVTVGIAAGYFLLWRNPPSLPSNFVGHVEAGFEEVEKAFRYNFEAGLESDGSAYAVCHRGKMVVDLWGGYADKMALRRWKQDTMSMAFSTTKGVAALVIAVLVDRGQLDYDALVTKYWPEFGKNGKENVTVDMLMSHEAGLVDLDEPITVESVHDWRKMSPLFENQAPNWPPGEKVAYHSFTFGFICEQLVRRVDPKRRSLGQFFHEEVAEPFGIDFYIGLPRDQLYRVARMTMGTFWDALLRLDWDLSTMLMVPLSYTFANWYLNRTTPDWLSFQGGFSFNDPGVQELEIASVNGIGTARGLAKLFCLLDGSDLLSEKTVKKISQPRTVTYHVPMIGGYNQSWSWGFMHTAHPWGSYEFGHPAYGGQNARFCPSQRLGVAYLRNNMAVDMADMNISFRRLHNATYECIGRMKSKD